ncbi:glycosyltransferase involved in cell wall biosynthesis [Bacillus mesophilus]|uniref:Glycosyltransferase family 4 protein n=1 Tax=Bacillus mesophilus TaxID=1808955 RepID=A0A6M0QAL8_9BACI|nr:glycosyltransferase family 4 protein [Bacillus mesophilus]MBM7662851.1 glycosyltransferase involved in cell wall biosynthesis [Bacillus mesophilus]NEY73441.1 glycosyltransferase family 4 protein [Bacillus mesophilus]
MNIWIFNHYSNGPMSSGGTRHYDLAKELVKKGYQVTIFASSFAHQASEDTRIINREKVKVEVHDGIRFVWIKTEVYDRNDWKRVKNILDYSFRAYHYAKKLKEQPDMIIGSLMHPLAPVIAYVLAKKKRAHFYFEERDLWPQTLIDIGKVSKYHPVVMALGKLETFLYKRAQKIIVLFHKAPDYVKGKGIDENKVLFLPNGVDLSRFRSTTPCDLPLEVEETLQHLKDRFIAIYTGSHGISDYLDSILWTANEMKEKNESIHFLLVGNGPEKEKLMKMKEKFELDNVTFLPSLLKEHIPTLLQRADVGLISLKDAELYKWGISFNKQYDYMAASLPTVLLSNRGEYHIEQSGGGVIVRSAEEMSEAILTLYKDEEKRKELGENARHFVEDHHSWDVLSTKLIDTFKETSTIELEGKG